MYILQEGFAVVKRTTWAIVHKCVRSMIVSAAPSHLGTACGATSSSDRQLALVFLGSLAVNGPMQPRLTGHQPFSGSLGLYTPSWPVGRCISTVRTRHNGKASFKCVCSKSPNSFNMAHPLVDALASHMEEWPRIPRLGITLLCNPLPSIFCHSQVPGPPSLWAWWYSLAP